MRHADRAIASSNPRSHYRSCKAPSHIDSESFRRPKSRRFLDDIPYDNAARSIWLTAQQLDRTPLMAKAYRVEPDEKLLAKIHLALDYWLVHDFKNPNWGRTRSACRCSSARPRSCFQPNVSKSRPTHREDHGAQRLEEMDRQNLVWGCANEIKRGLITGDDKLVTEGYSRMYEGSKQHSRGDPA